MLLPAPDCLLWSPACSAKRLSDTGSRSRIQAPHPPSPPTPISGPLVSQKRSIANGSGQRQRPPPSPGRAAACAQRATAAAGGRGARRGRPRGRSRQSAPGAVTPGRGGGTAAAGTATGCPCPAQRRGRGKPGGSAAACIPRVPSRPVPSVPPRDTHTHTRHGTAPGGGSRLGPRPTARPGRAGARVRPPQAPHLPGPRRDVGGRAPASRYCGGSGGPVGFGGGSVIQQSLGCQM